MTHAAGLEGSLKPLQTSDSNALERAKLTSLQDMCMNPILEKFHIETSNFWISKVCQTLISSPQDFLANLIQLLANAKGGTTAESMYFSNSLELSNSSNLGSCSLKIRQDYLTMTMAPHSGKYCYHFGSVGTMRNGKLLTANVSSPKRGKGSTLSQVLQKNVSPQYFHSHVFLAQIHKQLTKEKDPNQHILNKNGEKRSRRKHATGQTTKGSIGS